MKFTIEARNEQGELGQLTLIRRSKNLMEYWSFHAYGPDILRNPGDRPDSHPGLPEGGLPELGHIDG